MDEPGAGVAAYIGRWRPSSSVPPRAAAFALAIAILKLAGHASIAAACRHHARDATRALAALGLSPP